jgi:hypothetical protein
LDRCAAKVWQMEVREDLAFEYSLMFDLSKLEVSAKSDCPVCSVIQNGIELMSRELVHFDCKRACRGRFIVQPGYPLEIELIEDHISELEEAPPLRIQYYSPEGAYRKI